jgi:hypothetical protein
MRRENREKDDIAWYGPETKIMGKWSPNDTDFQQLVKSEDQRNDAVPYPFYLAYALEGEVSDLGALEDWVKECEKQCTVLSMLVNLITDEGKNEIKVCKSEDELSDLLRDDDAPIFKSIIFFTFIQLFVSLIYRFEHSLSLSCHDSANF